MPRLVEIHDTYGDMGVDVVSIDTGSRSKAAESFLDENNVTHIVLNDLKGDVARSYRVTAIPVTVIIDGDGRVMFRHLGFSDSMMPRFEKEIETLVAWRDAA